MASLESSTEDKLANQLDSLTTNPDAQAAAEALAAPLAAEPTGVQSAAAAAAVAEVAASLPSMDFPPEEIRDSPEFVSERETFMVDGARVPDTELVSQVIATRVTILLTFIRPRFCTQHHFYPRVPLFAIASDSNFR